MSIDREVERRPVVGKHSGFAVDDPVWVYAQSHRKLSWSPGSIIRQHSSVSYDVQVGAKRRDNVSVQFLRVRMPGHPSPTSPPEERAADVADSFVSVPGLSDVVPIPAERGGERPESIPLPDPGLDAPAPVDPDSVSPPSTPSPVQGPGRAQSTPMASQTPTERLSLAGAIPEPEGSTPVRVPEGRPVRSRKPLRHLADYQC